MMQKIGLAGITSGVLVVSGAIFYGTVEREFVHDDTNPKVARVAEIEYKLRQPVVAERITDEALEHVNILKSELKTLTDEGHYRAYEAAVARVTDATAKMIIGGLGTFVAGFGLLVSGMLYDSIKNRRQAPR